MTVFAYKARDSQGRPVEGTVEAASPAAAAELLASNGAIPLQIAEQRAKSAGLPRFTWAPGAARPTLTDLLLFSRQAYSLTKAGVPITRGFGQLAQTTRNPMLAEAIEEILQDLESGRDLGGAMARHPKVFGPLYVNMIRVGEESGRLEEAFLRMSEHLEREQRTVNQIKTALRYPTIVVAAIVIAVFVLMTWVIPAFAGVYRSFDLQLPLPTRIIIAVADFFRDNWGYVLFLMVAGVVGFRRYITTERGRAWWDRIKLRFPIVGEIILRGTLARFSRAFAMASRSGVAVLQALTVTSRAVDNEFIAAKIVEMRAAVERGESLMRAAAVTGVFTPLVLQMIAIGEETGQVDDMLEEVAEFYEREVDYDVKRLNDLLQPLLTLIMAVLVLILALGVFLPMWDLTQIARH